MISIEQLLSMIVVGMLWGCTNPLLRKGSLSTTKTTSTTTDDDDDGDNGDGDGDGEGAGKSPSKSSSSSAKSKSKSSKSTSTSTINETLKSFMKIQVWLPYVLNQSGSIVFYVLLSNRHADLSLTVPTCNALALVFSFMTSYVLGEKFHKPFQTVLGAALILGGVAICVQSTTTQTTTSHESAVTSSSATILTPAIPTVEAFSFYHDYRHPFHPTVPTNFLTAFSNPTSIATTTSRLMSRSKLKYQITNDDDNNNNDNLSWEDKVEQWELTSETQNNPFDAIVSFFDSAGGGSPIESKSNQNNFNSRKNNFQSPPRPPSIPPPMRKFQQQQKQKERSQQQDKDILLKAEQALQRSRVAAELRRQDALRQTQQSMRVASEASAAAAAAERITRDQQQQGNPEQRRNDNGTRRIQADKTERPTARISTRKRRTVSLEDLFDQFPGSNTNGQSSSSESNYDDIEIYDDEATMASTKAPRGVPVLYDWIQDQEDGSITGSIRGSSSFKDGATVSTSCVKLGQKGGTTITTSSGSRYYLADRNQVQSKKYESITDRMFQVIKPSDSLSSEARKTHQKNKKPRRSSRAIKPPTGVPIIRSWKLNNDGGISGVIFRSKHAADGDYIETSCLDDTSVAEARFVVQTLSGSRYYLCDKPAEAEIPEVGDLFQGFSPLRRRRGTITISKSLRSAEVRKDVSTAMNALEKAPPRTTFSLFDLLGAKPKKPVRPPSRDSVPDRRQIAPDGVPTLTQWSCNDDGTISGTIFGSSKIRDGNLINTSPIAAGQSRRFRLVTTVTGSVYFLG